MSVPETSCFEVFLACERAAGRGELIRRVSERDKEFHFQDWFASRLNEANIRFDGSGRNTYPDFPLVNYTEAYEIKGLAWPGRDADYDANSQLPSGHHNGRDLYYVFGRYPKEPDGNQYPLIDLVICHGDLLNADHEYVHKNRSFRGLGSYGDIMVRDRKMYVAPTPFALTTGTTGQRTLIVPESMAADSRFKAVGQLSRREAERTAIGYSFDLVRNEITPAYQPNPSAGTIHRFIAYRPKGSHGPQVVMSNAAQSPPEDIDGN